MLDGVGLGLNLVIPTASLPRHYCLLFCLLQNFWLNIQILRKFESFCFECFLTTMLGNCILSWSIDSREILKLYLDILRLDQNNNDSMSTRISCFMHYNLGHYLIKLTLDGCIFYRLVSVSLQLYFGL